MDVCALSHVPWTSSAYTFRKYFMGASTGVVANDEERRILAFFFFFPAFLLRENRVNVTKESPGSTPERYVLKKCTQRRYCLVSRMIFLDPLSIYVRFIFLERRALLGVSWLVSPRKSSASVGSVRISQGTERMVFKATTKRQHQQRS